MSDITVTTTSGATRIVTDTLGAAASAQAAATSAAAASASASSAATQATNAASSATDAQTAQTAAEAAQSNAEGALTDALAIYGSISAVQIAASNAAASASAASTSATTASNSATAAASSATAASGSVTTAASSATAAASSASTATAQAAAAAASATSAASVVSQDLSVIDKTVFAATIVDAFIYDTERDSDGGAWRKRCAHTSWENETLSGNWLGSAANETAARAISGATTGSYYYDTTAVKFYTLNASSGRTEVFRGNTRKFPARVLITVEAARVVLWDLTQAGAPMFLVFATTAGYSLHSGTVTSVAAINGQIVVGMSTQAIALRFVADRAEKRNATDLTVNTLTLASRNSAGTWASAQTSGAIVNAAINDVAMTVLPNAPVDVATGLPVPTIAVATAGNATYSTSVIMNDGSVVNVASDSTGTAVGVEFDGLSLKVIRSDGTVYYWNDVRALTTGASPSATVSASTTPAALGTASKQAKRALSSSTGLTLMRRNQLTLASSLLAYITKDYNSGWMPGDIRGAWLADTVAETVTGAEVVTNGGLTVNATGWTTLNGAGLAHGANGVTITNAGATYGGIYQALTGLTVGKKYTVTMKVTGCYGVPARWGVPDSVPTTASGIGETTVDATLIHTFEATATTHYLVVGNRNDSGGYNTFGSISLRRADVDRSVKAKGLQIFGSLTKAAVASGAALMGYSGFSAANYAEQPYNSDLDFGTGDFCIMGWFNKDGTAFAAAANQTIAGRGVSGVSDTWYLERRSGNATFGFSLVGIANLYSTLTMALSSWCFFAFKRVSGVSYFCVNGIVESVGSGISGQSVSGSSSPVLRAGCRASGFSGIASTGLALLRASATAPSDEQLRHIYETERPMFEANASCVLAGSSNAVTALAYDDETDLLHVGTSYGRSAFKGLVRVASEATPVGAITALAASAGVVVQGGASGADVYVPAYTLREELLRDAEQMAKFGQNLIAHDFTATASQTTFTLPVGWEIVAVYQQGAIKRETTSWTRSFDGFKWSAVLGTGATVSDWISILAKRV